jgi:NADPH:quinone reductase-like Zn-dependent oxidoreductase
MKAIVYTKYGPPDVLHLEEVKKPPLNEDQVQVKVYAASIFHDRDQKS